MSTFVILLLAGVQEISPEDRELFEAKIRPVLAEHCYSCHNSHTKRKGGLAVDDRRSIRRGGASGPAVVPGSPERSLLLSAIRHATRDLRMPRGGPKLADEVLRNFEQWIRKGAPDPRDAPPSPEELATATSWEETLRRRRRWWSFQPIRAGDPPVVAGATHPIDRFIRAKLREAGLASAPPADRRALIRRLTFGLTGLPPTPAGIRAYLDDKAPGAYGRMVDRLLASEHFGERWARHWMDWFRYAESHGSEGDPRIPHAYRYRDYLIRALNADIPYDQLVREHLAGDLLENPRINRDLGINESALGIAHLRMVFLGFFPTDALDEQVRFTDNQIDVLSKALLGLTVSCARCHNHKFDAISQKDFYALYGILASVRPALITVDAPERRDTSRKALSDLKPRIRATLAEAWLGELGNLEERLNRAPAKLLEEARKSPAHPLHAWARPRGREEWSNLVRQVGSSREALRKRRAAGQAPAWNLAGKDYRSWSRHGSGLPERPAAAGSFHLLPDGDRIVSNIYPAGIYTHLLSSRHNGMLTSPRFKVEEGEIWFRAMGTNDARARFVVQNYPRGGGTVYPVTKLKSDTLRWRSWGRKQVSYWKGDHVYFEIATAGDLPVEAKGEDGRSAFGISEVVFVKPGEPPPRDEPAEFVSPLFAEPDPPATRKALAARYAAALRRTLEAWRSGTMSDPQARFLGAFVRAGLLSNSLKALPSVAPLVSEYRALERAIPSPVRSPGVVEAEAFDQPFFPRGNHRKPGEPVPRRFLEALGGRAYETKLSGRRELAEDILSSRNPLAARVIVNRIWHHLFGRGIVATPDNFGRLGEKPTHPELLDHLAARFARDGWSIKKMVRLIVTSSPYRSAGRAPAAIDPGNRLLSHFSVRRLEAEAIRDAMLAVSGRLDRTRYGPGVDGRSPRRSVYVQVIRNRLDPFLLTFDAPEPLSARGRRNVTNVPGQSLTMMNDPWVIGVARDWSARVLGNRSLPDTRSRLNAMYESALGRPPTGTEAARAMRFLQGMEAADEESRKELDRIAAGIRSARSRLAGIVDPVKARILEERRKGGASKPRGPEPIAFWDFSKGVDEQKTGLKGHLRGGARLNGSALEIDGRGSYLETDALPWELREKTLEAWVVLGRMDQRGGGVMTVQTPNGNEFDSIVFGEKDPRRWLAGSDYFKRTRSFGGVQEAEAARRPVHVAITYSRDGLIAGYREGRPYGRPYRSRGLRVFREKEATILFGCRHLPAGGNRLLAGRILKARLYDRALTAEEVAASAGGDSDFVSDREIVGRLSDESRAETERLEREIERLEKRREKLAGPAPGSRNPGDLWRDLAQSIFNLKEFIYIR